MPLIVALSCNTTKKASDNKETVELTQCPKDGKCNFSISTNTDLKILEDEFNNRYPKITSGDNVLLKFQYERDKIPDVADSGYIEEIYIEINPNDIPTMLKDEELQKIKLLFARLCFCRGQTGYYKITKGMISFEEHDSKSYRMNLQFTCDEVPQIIMQISETFNIE